MRPVQHSSEADPRSILVVLPTWVGDFVMATPTLRALRDRFADAHITFLMEPNLRELVAGGDWMNESIEWPLRGGRDASAGASRLAMSPRHKPYRDLVWDLRRRRFDWAVLLPNSFRAALLARLIAAGRRIGYDRDGRGMLLTDRLPVTNRRHQRRGADRRTSRPTDRDRTVSTKDGGSSPARAAVDSLPWTYTRRFWPVPLVEYYADLAETLDCRRPGDRLELFTTPECEDVVQERLAALGISDHRPLVVISPGAKYGAAKCWMPERFAAVADRLIEEERAAVVITCGPGEESIARRIGAAMRREGLVLDDPLLSLGGLKALIRRCDLLLCNDAGPRHFAKAFGVGVVTVFGPTHPHWTATGYGDERIVRVELDCSPCQQRVCPLGHLDCMTGVSVDAVFGACTELLHARIDTAAAHAPHV